MKKKILVEARQSLRMTKPGINPAVERTKRKLLEKGWTPEEIAQLF